MTDPHTFDLFSFNSDTQKKPVDVVKDFDLNHILHTLASLSLNNPDQITPELLRQSLGQAFVDRLATQLNSKADIINIDIDHLIDTFINRYDSPYTQSSYRRSITHFIQWTKSAGVHPLEVSGDMADNYTAELRAVYSSAKANSYISGISSFYSHLTHRGHILHSPFTRIKRAKIPYTLHHIPSIETLVSVASTCNNFIIERAIRFMLITGLRVGALATLTLEHGKYSAFSKGKKYIGILNTSQIKKLKPCLHDWKNTNWLTVKIHRLMKKSGIKGGAHLCRHRFALDLYKKSNHDVEAVRRALGHDNIAVTTAYLQGLVNSD